MNRADVVIIGGGPAGIVTALSAKSNDKDKRVLLIRESKDVLVPCAIPYIFGKTLGDSKRDLVPDSILTSAGVELLIERVESTNLEEKFISIRDEKIYFDKLVFATGSIPKTPKTLKGVDSNGVYTVPKSREKIDELKSKVEDRDRVVVVGSGFIGIELALEFAEDDKEVILIGSSEYILKSAFDSEFAKRAEDILIQKGVKLLNNSRVLEILTDNKNSTEGVKICNGEVISTDLIILAIGYQPNIELAKSTELLIGKSGGIWVDEFMRTTKNDIFAVGDCAQRRDFITRKPSKVMLASTSSAEGRIAGNSLYKLNYLKGFGGTIAIFSTFMNGLAFSSAGVTEQEAKQEGLDIIAKEFEGVNRHPASLPDTKKQLVKLIVMRRSGEVIGGQIIGGVESGEMINIIGMIIENRVTIYSLLSLQVATHPLLTSAPTAYPIIKVAELISRELN